MTVRPSRLKAIVIGAASFVALAGPAHASSPIVDCASFNTTLGASTNFIGTIAPFVIGSPSFNAGDTITVTIPANTFTQFSLTQGATSYISYSDAGAQSAILNYTFASPQTVALTLSATTLQLASSATGSCTAASSVPTVSGWAMMALVGLLMTVGLWRLRRGRRQV